MKKIRFFVVSSIIIFGTVAYAGEIRTGEVTKVENDSVTIEDFDTGKEVKILRDPKTRIKGNLEKGALIELEERKGRAVSINVVAEEEETGEEPSQQEADTEHNE